MWHQRLLKQHVMQRKDICLDQMILEVPSSMVFYNLRTSAQTGHCGPKIP